MSFFSRLRETDGFDKERFPRIVVEQHAAEHAAEREFYKIIKGRRL
jgi:hypothetical protein